MARTEADVYALVVGKVIARLREQRRWTQGQLAGRIGIAQSTLSRIETGQTQPDAFTLRQLARAFTLTMAQLEGHIENAYARTQEAAKQTSPRDAADETPWWKVALGVAGVVGLAGLIGFAVAAVVDGEEGDGQR